jgi:general secretion pathway protein D
MTIYYLSARKSDMNQFVDDRNSWPPAISHVRGSLAVPRKQGASSLSTQAGPHFLSCLRCVLALLLVLTLSLPVFANQADMAYKRGQKAESQNDYDTAFQAYSEASNLEPKNPKYLASVARLRFYAAMQHVHTGASLRDAGKLNEAEVEFQRALQIDPKNLIAELEARRTADMIKRQARQNEPVVTQPQSPLAKMVAAAEGPVEFQPPTNTPINMRMSSNSDQAYKIIGKLSGVNVLFDPDYKPQKITIELNDVSARQALEMVALQSKTFYQPIATNTILVAADTAAKRKEYEHTSMKMFFLRNVATAAELQEAAKTVSSLLDLNRVQIIPSQNALVFRGTKDQLILAEKLITDLDKPKAEVMIEIAVLEVSRDRLRTIGTNPPTSIAIQMTSPVGTQTSGGGINPTGSSGSSGSSAGGGSTFTINSFARLTGNNFLVTIPGASMSFLMSDSNTKVLQNPEIRALDNEKATLKIGDRVPVATGSFAPGGGGGISPLVSTQFQYLDVGVNVDITPHIHSEREVTLKMSLEISTVTGQQNIGGISQPIIGQRRIEQETRLGDGDVNLVGGILEDGDTKSLAGYPYLAKIPILKYLFAQEEKQRQEREIVFAITPHIVRAQDITEDNLRLVDVGTGSTIGVRTKEPTTTSPEDQAKSSRSRTTATPAPQKAPVPATPPTSQLISPPPPPTTQSPPGSTSPH